MLNKTNMTIYRWIKSGKISSVVIAGKIFINPANIQNMTKKGETA